MFYWFVFTRYSICILLGTWFVFYWFLFTEYLICVLLGTWFVFLLVSVYWVLDLCFTGYLICVLLGTWFVFYRFLFTECLICVLLGTWFVFYWVLDLCFTGFCLLSAWFVFYWALDILHVRVMTTGFMALCILLVFPSPFSLSRWLIDFLTLRLWPQSHLVETHSRISHGLKLFLLLILITGSMPVDGAGEGHII